MNPTTTLPRLCVEPFHSNGNDLLELLAEAGGKGYIPEFILNSE